MASYEDVISRSKSIKEHELLSVSPQVSSVVDFITSFVTEAFIYDPDPLKHPPVSFKRLELFDDDFFSVFL